MENIKPQENILLVVLLVVLLVLYETSVFSRRITEVWYGPCAKQIPETSHFYIEKTAIYMCWIKWKNIETGRI